MSAINAGLSGKAGKGRIPQAVLSALASQRKGLPLTSGMAGATGVASWAQQQLWMLEQFAPGQPINNLCVAYRLRGDLRMDRLTLGIDRVVERHDVLRTTFALDGDRLQRQVKARADVRIGLEHLDNGPAGVARAADEAALIAGWVETHARRPFVEGELPLLRASVLRLGADDHVLALTTHHMAFDGWSFDILMRELCMFYSGDPASVDWTGPRYGDYAAWQRHRARGEESSSARAFWSAQLAHAPVATRMPPDRSTKTTVVRRSRRRSFTLDACLMQRVEELADRAATSDFVVYLAAYIVLLHRYTATREVVVGFPVANRCMAETRSMIGPFVNMLPILGVIEPGSTFGDVLSQLGDLVPDAYAHQGYPLGALAEGAAFVDVRTQCNFAYQNVPQSGWKLGELDAEAWDVSSGCIANDMTLFLWREGDGMSAHVDYDGDRFEAATIDAFCGNFCRILYSAAQQVDEPVACLTLDCTDTSPSAGMPGQGARGAVPRPETTVHEAFRAQARATPDAIALVADGRSLDYATVDRMSDRVSRHLRARVRVRPDADRGSRQVIAISLPPSLERIVLVLAILKTGAAYLALDHALPRIYADALLEEASAQLVVVEDAEAWRGPVGCVALNALFSLDDDAADEAGAPVGGSAEAACLMFTSGSSGRAKRITIPHRGIVNLARAPSYLDPVQGEAFMQLAPLSFDASLFEIWGALLNGGRLVVLPADKPSLGEIASAIRRHGVGVLWMSSGLFEVMLDSHPEALRVLRQLLIGGDVVSPAHVDRYLALPGAGRLFNCYGPTENTTFTTVHPITRGNTDPSAPIPIGRPIHGATVRVLDPSGSVVPTGIVGEACVGGAGLMLEYDGADGRLIDDESGAPGDRLYRTGDAVRWRADGGLDFVGRHDRQVKLRGFRIEPAQVESALRRSELVSACAVAGCDVGNRGLTLVAAVVPVDRDADPNRLATALQAGLRRELPAYMVPQCVAVVDALPLTANGKIERSALSRLFPPAEPSPAVASPLTHDETIIHAAFARALGHDRFGIHDDFFLAGGDSLGTLQLVAHLEREYGEFFSLVDVFERRTVAALAARVGARGEHSTVVAVPDGLVPLTRGRGPIPLFFVPGGKGSHIEMTLYAELMKHVGGEMPVYGVLTKPESGGRATLADRAAAYIERMRSLRGRGPYLVAGECIGGLVALEMARQLKRQNEDVVLMLMDTWCPTPSAMLNYYARVRPMTEIRAVAGTVRAMAREYARARSGASARTPHLAASMAMTSARLTAGALWRMVTPDRPRPGFGADADFDLFRDAVGCRPGRYTGDAVFITSDHNLTEGIVEPWRELVDELTVVAVPGNHETYLREQVLTTAAAVRRSLDVHLRQGHGLQASSTKADAFKGAVG